MNGNSDSSREANNTTNQTEGGNEKAHDRKITEKLEAH
jgi:hypothetical protein